MTTWQDLETAPYISLVTFRKSGIEVATPVWVAGMDGHLYVFSEGHAGKVKRLRNNPAVRLATCNFKGDVSGEWLDGVGELVSDAEEISRALAAFHAKYGWQTRVGEWLSKLSGKFHKRAYIRILHEDVPS